MAVTERELFEHQASVYVFPTDRVRAAARRQAAARARVRRRRAVLGLGAVVIALAGLAGMGESRGKETASTAPVVVVQGGDTLWEIATAHTPAGGDPRRFLQQIVELNDLGAHPPVPGTRLVLPR